LIAATGVTAAQLDEMTLQRFDQPAVNIDHTCHQKRRAFPQRRVPINRKTA